MTKASTFYKRNYTNGYQQKVEYWSLQISIAAKYDNVEKLETAKKKLNYFTDKQIDYVNQKEHDILAERIGLSMSLIKSDYTLSRK